MPYLDPEHVLQQFAGYLQGDVRDAIDDDHKFVKAQVGSMSSSLNFLARELDSMTADLETQRESLLDALDAVEETIEDDDKAADVEASIEDARARIEDADTNDDYEYERVLTDAATDVLETIDEMNPQEATRVREPLYAYINTRVRTQIEALGGDR